MSSILVIGAGVIGAAIADTLAQRGANVTVLDMRGPGLGATQASAGILAPYIEAHGETPMLGLGTRSLAMYDAFVEALVERTGRTIDFAKTGTLEVALGAPDEERLQETRSWLVSKNVECVWLDARALRTFAPAVNPSASGGLHIPLHGVVGARALNSALVHSARLSGAEFESPVEAVEVDPRTDRVDVSAGSRKYSADFVLIASGSWSRRVRIKGVVPLPVRPVRGQLLHLRRPSPQPPSPVVWGPRCYTVSWPDGSLLVGATVEEVGFDECATVGGIQALTSAVAELLPETSKASFESVRVGLRPALPDELPAIGPFALAPRVIAATGHYRNGILLAPLTAAMVAGLVLDRINDPALTITTPDRFAV